MVGKPTSSPNSRSAQDLGVQLTGCLQSRHSHAGVPDLGGGRGMGCRNKRPLEFLPLALSAAVSRRLQTAQASRHRSTIPHGPLSLALRSGHLGRQRMTQPSHDPAEGRPGVAHQSFVPNFVVVDPRQHATIQRRPLPMLASHPQQGPPLLDRGIPHSPGVSNQVDDPQVKSGFTQAYQP